MTAVSIARRDAPAPAFERPAELVDVSERVYRGIFAVGLWVATAMSVFAAAISLLQPGTGSQWRGFAVCVACVAACVVAARRPAVLYAALRRGPWQLAGAGVAIGAGASWVGVHNFELFLPLIAVIGVAGIATPRRVVVVAGVAAGVGLGAPQLLEGEGNVGATFVVLVPPLLFWLIVERIAGFTLRLHAAVGPVVDPPSAPGARHAPPQPASRRGDAVGLPVPRVIDVGGVRLSTRQLQVVLLACEGLRHAEIAACLQIGTPTVRRHLVNARARAGASTTPQLVAWAQREGLVPVPRG